MTHDSAFPRPDKRLGQHFLIDPNIVRKIVTAADLRPDETVLEIGPGRGILTRALCGQVREVIAIELDDRLRAPLTAALADCPNVDVRFADALRYPYHTLPAGLVVVANLPYYISTPLLFVLFEARAQVARMILMLQTEVARRLVAPPGSREYGTLSVLSAYYAEVQVAFHVSRECFRPRPDVGSTIVRLRLRSQPPVPVHSEAALIATVRAAFAHRRKTLLNSLRDEGRQPERIREALALAAIPPASRAETLTLEEFAALANALVTVEGVRAE